MTELLFELSFSCCHCEATTYFTVHCAGAGLDAGTRITLTAAVPCFACGARHNVRFHPTGEVVAAEPRQEPLRRPIPSRN
jgi:hypothetical protein